MKILNFFKKEISELDPIVKKWALFCGMMAVIALILALAVTPTTEIVVEVPKQERERKDLGNYTEIYKDLVEKPVETKPVVKNENVFLPGDVIQSNNEYYLVWIVEAKFYVHPYIPSGDIRSTMKEDDVKNLEYIAYVKIELLKSENVAEGLVRHAKRLNANIAHIISIDQEQRVK